jgi:hypothetical protein
MKWLNCVLAVTLAVSCAAYNVTEEPSDQLNKLIPDPPVVRPSSSSANRNHNLHSIRCSNYDGLCSVCVSASGCIYCPSTSDCLSVELFRSPFMPMKEVMVQNSCDTLTVDCPSISLSAIFIFVIVFVVVYVLLMLFYFTRYKGFFIVRNATAVGVNRLIRPAQSQAPANQGLDQPPSGYQPQQAPADSYMSAPPPYANVNPIYPVSTSGPSQQVEPVQQRLGSRKPAKSTQNASLA